MTDENDHEVGAGADESDSEPGFEEFLERLESIADTLERGDIRLERALTLFQEGVQLARRASVRLQEAEQQLERLTREGTEPMTSSQPSRDADE